MIGNSGVILAGQVVSSNSDVSAGEFLRLNCRRVGTRRSAGV